MINPRRTVDSSRGVVLYDNKEDTIVACDTILAWF